MAKNKLVFYAVLNWGLGHATRSIPVIRALIENAFEPVLASDGAALQFLSATFPTLKTIELPGLDVRYAEKGSQVRALLHQSGNFLAWQQREMKVLQKHFLENTYDGLISDNRPMCFNKHCPNVYLTHQINVRAGMATWPAKLVHRKLFSKYHQVWVPDNKGDFALAGALSNGGRLSNIHFIGPQSDLTPIVAERVFHCAILLSGPEPQRSLLERGLVEQLGANPEIKVKLIRGTTQKRPEGLPSHWHVVDVASREEVQQACSESEVIIARNGYSTLMDLAIFPKPAILIPTPGQPEQEYLATLPIHQKNYVFQKQETMNILAGISQAKSKFAGRENVAIQTPDWGPLFSLFKGEGEG